MSAGEFSVSLLPSPFPPPSFFLPFPQSLTAVFPPSLSPFRPPPSPPSPSLSLNHLLLGTSLPKSLTASYLSPSPSSSLLPPSSILPPFSLIPLLQSPLSPSLPPFLPSPLLQSLTCTTTSLPPSPPPPPLPSPLLQSLTTTFLPPFLPQ